MVKETPTRPNRDGLFYFDEHGAEIRVGDPVYHEYPWTLSGGDPVRTFGVCVGLGYSKAYGRSVQYREYGTQHLRDGALTHVRFDWHPNSRVPIVKAKKRKVRGR
jgi:hypothetical protein